MRNPQIKVQPSQDPPQFKNVHSGPFRIHLSEKEEKPLYRTPPLAWTNFQTAKYAAFISYYKNKMDNRPHQGLWNLYTEMAEFIGTRNFRQCKSHHQKHCERLGNINGIIANIKKQVDDFDTLLHIQQLSLQKFLAQKREKLSTIPKSSANLPEMCFEGHQLKFPKQSLLKTGADYFPEALRMMNPQSNQPVPFFKFTPMYMGFETVKGNEKDWIECHKLFIEWTSKMKQLFELSKSF